MTATTVVVLLVVLLAVLAVAWWALQRRRRTQVLRRRFGDEYDRTLERTGNRRETEQTLNDLAGRREQLDIRPLTAQERKSWVEQWGLVQSRFVDAPAEAVTTARELLPGLMRDRGYPTEDFDQRAALLATDHPVVVGEYRAAEQAYQRHLAVGGSSTEALRQSLVHYRALFNALVDPSGSAGDGAAVDGAAVDGAAVNGATANGTTVNGTAVNGTTVNGTTANGAAVNGAAVNGTAVGDDPHYDADSEDERAAHGRHVVTEPAEQPVEDSTRGARR